MGRSCWKFLLRFFHWNDILSPVKSVFQMCGGSCLTESCPSTGRKLLSPSQRKKDAQTNPPSMRNIPQASLGFSAPARNSRRSIQRRSAARAAGAFLRRSVVHGARPKISQGCPRIPDITHAPRGVPHERYIAARRQARINGSTPRLPHSIMSSDRASRTKRFCQARRRG